MHKGLIDVEINLKAEPELYIRLTSLSLPASGPQIRGTDAGAFFGR
jgi:hypothetical protein